MHPGVERRTASAFLSLIRQRTGLSQRSFAEVVGTSGPTIAAYESGAKEPRWSTLERIANDTGHLLDVRLVGTGRGAALRARRERRGLALAAAVAGAVTRDFERAIRLAEKNLVKATNVMGTNRGQRWLDEWRTILDRGPDAVCAALLDTTPHGHDMRQVNPFAGLLTDAEREAALAAVDAVTELGRL